MIDKNGKLFGKINLIDLLILLVVLALAIFVVLRFTAPKENDVELVPVTITFYGSEEPDYVVEHLKKGSPVKDLNEDSIIGTLEEVELGDPISYIGNGNDVVPVSKENHNSVKLHVSAEGELNDFGVDINGVHYAVGHSLVVFAGDAKLYIRVSDIQPAE